MTVMANRRSVTGEYFDGVEAQALPKGRTQTTDSDANPVLADLMRDWDEIFPEKTIDQGTRIVTAPRIWTCLVGEAGTAIVWRGTAHFLLGTRIAPAEMSTWTVDLSVSDTDKLPEGSPSAGVIHSVEWVMDALGTTERDVLLAAGVSPRTYYNWKKNRRTAPRLGSQADLWAVVQSVQSIVEALDENAATWMKIDPSRREMFVEGQHARLAVLAAAAAAGVRIPSETLDGLGVETPDNAAGLKLFRTNYPLRFTHDENGRPLHTVENVEAAFYDEEAEDDVVLIDLDD